MQSINGSIRSKKYDVVGICTAMVDCEHEEQLPMEVISSFGLLNGSGMKLVTDQFERDYLLVLLDSMGGYKLHPGGSVANTLTGISVLGGTAAMCGSVAMDAMGMYFLQEQQQYGVTFINNPMPLEATGTVVVVTSEEEAQRYFLSYMGCAGEVVATDAVLHAVRNCRVLLLEGYLLDAARVDPNIEFEHTKQTLKECIRVCRAAGGKVALSLSDETCVARNRDFIAELLSAALLDIIFANAAEARELTGCTSAEATLSAAMLSKVELVVVTDGKDGAWFRLGDRVLHVVPPPCPRPVVDTTGAGDAFAAGFLFGYVRGWDAEHMGRAALECSNEVVSHFGPRLPLNFTLSPPS